MRTRNYLKLSLLALAAILNPRALVAATDSTSNFGLELIPPCDATIPLPTGCEDYKLIKGNPYKASIFLLGENHAACEKARFKCINALAKDKPKQDNVILSESADHTKHILCEDMTKRPGQTTPLDAWQKIADSCRGWNWPIRNTDNCWPTRNGQLKHLRDILQLIQADIQKFKVDTKSNTERTAMLTSILQNYIDQNKQILQMLKAEHLRSYQVFKNKNPEITIQNFHSDYNNGVSHVTFAINYLNKILGKIKEFKHSSALLSTINSYLNDEVNRIVREIKTSSSQAVYDQNRYLLQSIKSAVNDKKNVYAPAGDNHVTKTHKDAVIDKAVAELYAGLDELADENPYAVLSCSGK